MESTTRRLPALDWCERPQHLRVNTWQAQHGRGLGVYLWLLAAEPAATAGRAAKRAQRWRPKPTAIAVEPTVSQRLIEAKMRNFPAQGRQERIAKGLAALSQPPSILLSTEQWREVAEDPDLEDQF